MCKPLKKIIHLNITYHNCPENILLPIYGNQIYPTDNYYRHTPSNLDFLITSSKT
jgi:hypothetical protein